VTDQEPPLFIPNPFVKNSPSVKARKESLFVLSLPGNETDDNPEIQTRSIAVVLRYVYEMKPGDTIKINCPVDEGAESGLEPLYLP
jgi:hypothetical protein